MEEVIKAQMEAARPNFDRYALFPELASYQSKAELLDFSKPYVKQPSVLRINEEECLTLADIHGITGQAGAGKTMFVSMVSAAVLSGEYGNMSYCLGDVEEPTLLLIDTEQSESDCIQLKNRIQTMMGRGLTDHRDDFHIVRLRNIDKAEDRDRETFKAIIDYHPTVAIVDGMIDLVPSINDEEKCANLVYRLMKLASTLNICIIGVIHQNPTYSKNFEDYIASAKMSGHLGSTCDRKGRDIFEIVKNTKERLYTVKAIKSRGHKPMEKWDFTIQESDTFKGGIPVPVVSDASERYDIDRDIRQWLHDYQNTITWPATHGEVQKLFENAGVVDKAEQAKCKNRAKNRGFLIEQRTDEMSQGQKRPRLKLNHNEILPLPCEKATQPPLDNNLPFKPPDGKEPPF